MIGSQRQGTRRWGAGLRKRIQKTILTWCPGVNIERVWSLVGVIGSIYLGLTLLQFCWSVFWPSGFVSSRLGSAPLQAFPQEELCSPPIDVVYTWVNGSDPRLQKLLGEHKAAACAAAKDEGTTDTDADGCRSDMASASRYVDNEELRFSLRSVLKFAPWVRHIYVVTNGQVPHWLRIDHPRLSVVSHEQIFSNLSHLPTFSSPAIEVHLHKIPGLSDQFIYLNDDVMFGGPIFPDDFVTHAGGQNVFLSWAVPNCNEGCPANWIGDGYCDIACNVSSCEWDGGDCKNASRPSYGGYSPPSGSENRWWNSFSSSSSSSSSWTDRLSRYCTPGCPDSWIGDKYCDRACENALCGFDGGDCGIDVIAEGVNGTALSMEHNGTVLNLPGNSPSYYFNFTPFVGSSKILDGSHDNTDLVRTATISQKSKLMIMTFHRNVTAHNVSVVLSYESPDDPTISLDFVFIFELHTIPPPNISNPASPPQSISSPANITVGIASAAGASPPPLEPASASSTSSPSLSSDSSAEETLGDGDLAGGRKLLGFEAAFNYQQKIKAVVAVDGKIDEQLADWIASKKNDELVLLNERAAYQEASVHQHPISKWETLVAQDSSDTPKPSTSRRLFDIFGDSLKFVDRLYNRAYGASARKVPAHMPHFINKHIMTELQSLWPQQYDATSSHRVRSSNDMQMAFAYFYHMVHYPREFNIDDIFAYLLDADSDGQLDENELRTLAAHVYGVPIDPAKFADLNLTLRLPPQSSASNATGSDSTTTSNTGDDNAPNNVISNVTGQPITLAALKQHPAVLELFQTAWRKLPKYRTSIQNTDEVAFVMIPSNNTQAKKSLDGIRSRRQRFICLNDNMNHSDPHSQIVVKTLREFYMSLVPIASEFELSPEEFHPEGLYIDELMAIRYTDYLKTNGLVLILLLLTITIICIVVKRRQKKRRFRRDRTALQIL